MRRYLYLSTAVGGVMMTAGAGASFAQCVTTQNCAELGYTETSCPDGTGLKCPFGNKWACLPTKESICKEEGFTLACNETGQLGGGDSCNGLYKQCSCDSSYQYTCSGTNETGGTGEACGGKYQSCTCASGYEWKDGSCTIQDTCPSTCGVGCLYYSDGSCGKDTDIPRLTNITSKSDLTDIQSSCTNTDIITNYGNRSTYPAAWAAKNYSPSGTPSGKSWCQPSGGLLYNALYNSTNLAKINAGIITAGGTKIGNVYKGSEYVWSSSEHSDTTAWYFAVNPSGVFHMVINNKDFRNSFTSVRPVLAF